MSQAVLSLGSNSGDRLGHLRAAVAGLRDVVLVVSGVYETPHWPPGADGPDAAAPVPAYLNAAVLVAGAEPDGYAWLARARRLEQAAGRVRDPGRRHAPRPLDVDVIAAWDDAGQALVSDDPHLVLPHPRAHLRAFVLRPWLDIQPYARLPGRGWVFDLIRTDPVAADVADVRPCPGLTLEST